MDVSKPSKYDWKHTCPICVHVTHDCGFKTSMPSLNYAVWGRMVRMRWQPISCNSVAKNRDSNWLPWSIVKVLSAPICDPIVVECTRNCCCFNVFDWDGYRPAGKSVDESYTVFVSVWFRQGAYVHMHMFETLVGHYKLFRLYMARYFWLLTVHAVLTPFRYIAMHVGPYMTLAYNTIHDLWIGMCCVVEYMEDSTQICKDGLPHLGHLTIERGIRRTHCVSWLMERSFEDGLKLFVILLLLCQLI